jgi:hypothetical protein
MGSRAWEATTALGGGDGISDLVDDEPRTSQKLFRTR